MAKGQAYTAAYKARRQAENAEAKSVTAERGASSRFNKISKNIKKSSTEKKTIVKVTEQQNIIDFIKKTTNVDITPYRVQKYEFGKGVLLIDWKNIPRTERQQIANLSNSGYSIFNASDYGTWGKNLFLSSSRYGKRFGSPITSI